MRFYRDIDYYLYFTDFPHMGVYGVAAANTDGTVNIYINTRYNEHIQERTIRHELRHMAKGHLWDDVKPVTEKELEADDPEGCTFGKDFKYVEWTPPVEFVDVFFDHADGVLPYFPSLSALRRYVIKRSEHYGGPEKTEGRI